MGAPWRAHRCRVAGGGGEEHRAHEGPSIDPSWLSALGCDRGSEAQQENGLGKARVAAARVHHLGAHSAPQVLRVDSTAARRTPTSWSLQAWWREGVVCCTGQRQHLQVLSAGTPGYTRQACRRQLGGSTLPAGAVLSTIVGVGRCSSQEEQAPHGCCRFRRRS